MRDVRQGDSSNQLESPKLHVPVSSGLKKQGASSNGFASLRYRRATQHGCAACDSVRLWPKPVAFALVELTRVAPRTRQDIDARGVQPLNLRRPRRQPA